MYNYRKGNLGIAVSTANPDPLYKQVTDRIREAIAAGSLVSGARLPSIRGMADELAISAITVRRAYADLEREGYIVTRPGMGSFVAGINRRRLRERKIEELRKEIALLVKTAASFGIPIADIRRIVDELRMQR